MALAVGIGSVSYLGRVLWTKRLELARALDLDATTLALLLLLMLGSHLQRTFEVNYVLRRLGVRERLTDGFWLTGATLLLNYLPLSAGSVTRAVVLRRVHALPYAHYVSALVVAAVMNGELAATSGFIASLAAAPAPARPALAAFFGALVVSGAIVLSLPASWAPEGKGILSREFRKLADGVRLVRGEGGLIALAVTSSFKLALNTLRLWLCFRALGVSLSLPTAVLLGATVLTTSLVHVAPGNIGLRELVLGVVSGAAGGSPVLGMAAASLERAVSLGYTVLAGLPAVHHVRRAWTRSAPESVSA